MSITAELADLMTQEITLERRTGVDLHGAPTYGPPETYTCRLERRQARLVDRSGIERLSKVRAYLLELANAVPLDRVTLPEGYMPQQPPILDVTVDPDDTGALVECIIT